MKVELQPVFLLVHVEGGLIGEVIPYDDEDKAVQAARDIWKTADPEEDDIKVLEISHIGREAIPFWDPRDDE